MLAEGHKANFETLVQAIEDGNVCLMDCTDAETGEKIATICAVSRVRQINTGDIRYEMVPLARLFNGNPYEELIPPMEEVH